MTSRDRVPGRVAVLSGGVGGARFAAGLQAALEPGALTVIVNTGDDFTHLGLRICPDVDSVVYGLAELSDESRGWGRAGESWHCLSVLAQLGADDWFALGDKDLGVHVWRSDALRRGSSLTEVTECMARRLGVSSQVIPMTESPVATRVITDEGELAFQDYFVRHHGRPRVIGLRYEGSDRATIPPQVTSVLRDPQLRAVLVAPSNPFLSVDPILAIPGMRVLLRSSGVPVIGVSPLIAGKAIKGPLTAMMDSLGVERSARGIVGHYGDLLDGWVVDTADATESVNVGVRLCVAPTLMSGANERLALARQVLAFAGECADG
jgi:LPPG:FO 2-phospho-L-lactate transferase